MYKFEGKIIYLSEKTSGVSRNGNSWSRRTAVIEMSDEQKSKILITFFGKIEEVLTENYDIDDIVEIDAIFNANEFSGKWFNNIYAKDIKLVSKHGKAAAEESRQGRSTQKHDRPKREESLNNMDEDNDDLPF